MITQFEVQIMEEEDQLRFGFDVLDPTKIVPEDIIPFTPLGKMTLNRNPRNYFAETEQVMVCYCNVFYLLTRLSDQVIVPSRPCSAWHRLH
jgi:catalase